MRAAALIMAGALAFTVMGCNKDDEDPEKVEDEDGKKKKDDKDEEAPAASASAEAEPSATAVATTTKTWTRTTTTTTTTTTTSASGQSISGCCTAIGAAAKEESNTTKKARLKSAMAMCYQTNALVIKGKTDRTSALAQVRATAGISPAACK